ncbi:MAG TPA: methyltransferase domain-containing protein [Acidimicrobiales bacterium]|nr:methyltransferase domain-containing protein [Acidimicrobiales bacterium]
MTTVNLPYIDAEIEQMDGGGEPPAYLRHFHWGLFDDPTVDDDNPERYYAAAENLTRRILDAAEVTDGRRVLDVGCGFGGTLDTIRARNTGCRLVGLNIDVRQLQWARRMLAAREDAASKGPISFVTGDGCKLPVEDASVDHVLAVECIFHFPSRKAFFREAARVLKPGGTLALSDFLLAPGSIGSVTANVLSLGLGDWYGRSASPLTSTAYERMGRGSGLEQLVDENITTHTLPTYPAMRRIYNEAGAPDGVATIDGVEQLAVAGGWEYHVLAYRKPA